MDVVYILKNTKHNEELRYSLRSLKNVKGIDRVVFAGGYPEDFQCDYHIPVVQDQGLKYKNTTKVLRAILEDDNLSENIVIMNDDFFIMQPLKLAGYNNIFDGTLADKIFNIERKNSNNISKYTDKLRKAYILLGVLGVNDPLNYETHTPFVCRRKYGRDVMDLQFDLPFRTLYEHILKNPKSKFKDHKISDLETRPTGKEWILSTTDNSFKNGKVGAYIRNKFKRKCKYEKM